MLALTLLFLIRQDEVRELDALARSRNVEGLAAFCKPGLIEQGAFRFLKENGPYGTGRFGWHAYKLSDPVGGGKYVVFGTRITSEDYGEYVFALDDGKLDSLIDEIDDRGYKIQHYDLDLKFNPKERRATIVCRTSYVREPGAAACLHARISPHYKVLRATDGEGRSLAFAQASGVVSVAVSDEASGTFVLEYTGIVDQPGYAGAITEKEVMLANDYWWPMVARKPATSTTTTHVPESWTVVAQGDRVSEGVRDGIRTVKYAMNVPVSYLSLSAGPFQHVEKKVGRINYHVWAHSMKREDMLLQLELMPSVVEFYERFGAYPFDSFGAMVSDVYGGGALEAYSYATYGTGWLPDEDSHEPAHTWWGGLLSNTYIDSFWNEGFAVFSGGLYAREVSIGNRSERRDAFVQHFNVTDEARRVACGKAGVVEGAAASSLGYGKSGAVLQQLEAEIGTDAIVASMKRWIEDNPTGTAANWGGFQSALSAVVGTDMDWFFDQWVWKPGAPRFEVTNVEWNNGVVYGDAEFFGDPYRLTVDVYAELITGGVHRAKVVLNPDRKSGKTPFSFALPSRPKLVSFDPFDRVFRERPEQKTDRLGSLLRRLSPVVDPKRPEYAMTFARMTNRNASNDGTLGKFYIGHPDTMPEMKALCAKVGFTVSGNSLTFRGTTIDLREGSAVAIVDLGAGKKCAIGLGKARRGPDFGDSKLCVADNYGRFLRGVTVPRREGSLVFTKL